MVEESTCVYCVKRPGLTRDHVPPKSFFPKPRPSDLITVPACRSCNREAGKDEELFLAAFMFGEAGVSLAGKKLWDEKLHRMYDKNRGLRRRIAKSMHSVDIFTPGGVFLGRGLGVRLEEERINRVVTKIIRGLYYHEYQEALFVLHRNYVSLCSTAIRSLTCREDRGSTAIRITRMARRVRVSLQSSGREARSIDLVGPFLQDECLLGA